MRLRWNGIWTRGLVDGGRGRGAGTRVCGSWRELTFLRGMRGCGKGFLAICWFEIRVLGYFGKADRVLR
jgi:hypothetical protein